MLVFMWNYTFETFIGESDSKTFILLYFNRFLDNDKIDLTYHFHEEPATSPVRNPAINPSMIVLKSPKVSVS